ncbi:MAG: hypothetical protein IJV75_00100 [Alphaproteobacteria bacterium]|nr:hypothetical protein [Alphaproteobacteria bacterium]
MKYIILILSVIVIILAVGCRFLFSEVTSLKEDNAALRLKNEGLTASINDFNDSQKTASQTITKIQEKIKYVEKDCNCYYMPIDDNIVEWVRGSKK